MLDDRGDFEGLYVASRQRLLGYVYLITGDLGEAQDVVQEAFARAWQRWSSVRGHPDPEAWVRLTASRIAVSWWRRMRIRAAAIGPLVGVAISGLIWATLPSAPSGPTAGASPSPSASPSVSISPLWSPPAITIPQRALLQPEDAGAGYRLDDPYIERANAGGAWGVGMLDTCPGYMALNITSYRQAIVLIGHNLRGPEETISNSITRYPEGVAPQVIADAIDAVRACPAFATNTEARDDYEARKTFTVLATDFAGKSSVLFRQKVNVHDKATGKHIAGYDEFTTTALIQQGDHVIQVYLERDASSLARQLSAKAVTRLCAAITC